MRESVTGALQNQCPKTVQEQKKFSLEVRYEDSELPWGYTNDYGLSPILLERQLLQSSAIATTG